MIFRKLLIGVALASALISWKMPLNNKPKPDNTLTSAEKKAGWQLLFDGKTLKGWRNFKKQTIGSAWIIQDNAIFLNAIQDEKGGWQAQDGGDIITDKEYENFELLLDWKISPCGNSGIIFNVVEAEKYDYVWHTGPEMQVLDNKCHADSDIKKHRAGDLYDLIESKVEAVKPVGQWNHVRIRQKNNKLDFWLNGKPIVSTTLASEAWSNLIAGSKFKDMPDFGKVSKGHIALQDHGNKVWYKNIKIKML